MFFDSKYRKGNKPTNRQLAAIRKLEKGDKPLETTRTSCLTLAAFLVVIGGLLALLRFALGTTQDNAINEHPRVVFAGIALVVTILLVVAGVSSVIISWRRHRRNKLIPSDEASEPQEMQAVEKQDTRQRKPENSRGQSADD